VIYPIKTLGQLPPILKAFRKAKGLTQAAIAERLGITQQSYAYFEANPASATMERLFLVLRMLNVEIAFPPPAPHLTSHLTSHLTPRPPTAPPRSARPSARQRRVRPYRRPFPSRAAALHQLERGKAGSHGASHVEYPQDCARHSPV
jgi:HTH-type transcriptional regulator/antitoxin HipB